MVAAVVPLRVNTNWLLELNPKLVVVLAPNKYCVVPNNPLLTQPDQVKTVEDVGVVNVRVKLADALARNRSDFCRV